jgi:hypothetical protein
MGQKKALLPFFTLGYVGLGRLVALLLTTFLGSVAFPAAVGTHIIVARLALAFPPPPLAASIPAIIVVPSTMMSPAAGSGPILGLHSGHHQSRRP